MRTLIRSGCRRKRPISRHDFVSFVSVRHNAFQTRLAAEGESKTPGEKVFGFLNGLLTRSMTKQRLEFKAVGIANLMRQRVLQIAPQGSFAFLALFRRFDSSVGVSVPRQD